MSGELKTEGKDILYIMGKTRQMIKVRQYLISHTIDTIPINRLPKRLLSRLKWDQKGDVDFEIEREKLLLHQGDVSEEENRRMKLMIAELKKLRLSDCEIQIQTHGGKIAIYVVDYGPLVDLDEDYEDDIYFKSAVDILPTVDHSRLSFDNGMIKIRMNKADMVSLDRRAIHHLISSIFPRIHTSDTLNDNGDGILIYNTTEAVYMRENQSVVLVMDSYLIGNYLPHAIKYAKNIPKRVIVVGGERPQGFTKLDVTNVRLDLLSFLDEKYFSLPFLQLMGTLYGEERFAEYFREMWISFQGGIETEELPMIHYRYLHDQLMGVEETSLAIDDYKQTVIQVVLQSFAYNEVFDRGDNIMLPDRVWLPAKRLRDDILLLSLLTTKYEDMAEPIDLIVFAKPDISNFVGRDRIRKKLEGLLAGPAKIYVSDKPQSGIYSAMIKLIVSHSVPVLRYLRTLSKDIEPRGFLAIMPNNELQTIGLPHFSEKVILDEQEIVAVKQKVERVVPVVTEEPEVKLDQQTVKVEWAASPIDTENEVKEKVDEKKVFIDRMLADLGVDTYVKRVYDNQEEGDRAETVLELISDLTSTLELLKELYHRHDHTMMREEITIQSLGDPIRYEMVSEIKTGDSSLISLTDHGKEFYIDAFKQLVDEKKKLGVERVREILDNISDVLIAAEDLGHASYVKVMIEWAKLVGYYEYSFIRSVSSELLAISTVWKDRKIVDIEQFSHVFFAQYYSTINDLQEMIKEEVDERFDHEEDDEIISTIPRVNEDEVSSDEYVDLEEDMEIVELGPKPHKRRFKPKDKEVEFLGNTEVDDYFPEMVREPVMSKLLENGYVLMGDTADEKRRDRLFDEQITSLDIPTRGINLLAEQGITTVGQLAEYNDAFVETKGIGDKINEVLREQRSILRDIDSVDLDTISSILSDEGKKNLLLKGGEVPVDKIPPTVLRKLDLAEKKKFSKLLLEHKVPVEIVRVFIGEIYRLFEIELDTTGSIEEVLVNFNSMNREVFLFDDSLQAANLMWIIQYQNEYERGEKDYAEWRMKTQQQLHTLVDTLTLPVNREEVKNENGDEIIPDISSDLVDGVEGDLVKPAERKRAKNNKSKKSKKRVTS